MYLLFYRCHQINQGWNLCSFHVLYDFYQCRWLSQMRAPLTGCMPTVCQNANPLICAAFHILFLSVPAWHCSSISDSRCLRKPDCTLLRSPAPRRNGPHLWDPETMCVQRKKKSVLQAFLWSFIQCLFKIILFFILCLCLFYLLFVSTSFIAASCFSSYITLAFLSLPLWLWLALVRWRKLY